MDNKHNYSTKQQFGLYQLIQNNLQQIEKASETFYSTHFKSSLFDEFEIESIVLNDSGNFEWELNLVKKGRFEICIVLFDRLTPINISFSA